MDSRLGKVEQTRSKSMNSRLHQMEQTRSKSIDSRHGKVSYKQDLNLWTPDLAKVEQKRSKSMDSRLRQVEQTRSKSMDPRLDKVSYKQDLNLWTSDLPSLFHYKCLSDNVQQKRAKFNLKNQVLYAVNRGVLLMVVFKKLDIGISLSKSDNLIGINTEDCPSTCYDAHK